jgi:5-methyltetrahydrofolate--homocysteine methyltransferase
MREELVNGIVELKKNEVIEMVKQLIEDGEDPEKILEDCRLGMTTVGDRFQQGDYYLAELMLSADIFKDAISLLDPLLTQTGSADNAGKVIIATLKGDIHDLGKDIFGTLLKAQGFDVYNMGVDVPPNEVLDKTKEIRPAFIGFSALITPTFERMKETIEMLESQGLRRDIKVLIGGGITTPAISDYVGADFQTIDAMSGVEYCMKNRKGE